MAAVDLASLTKEQHDELACTYAALILFDAESEITSDKIASVVKASKNEIESYWPMLFANALKD
jgi:large subunit ribosomal protein LP1